MNNTLWMLLLLMPMAALFVVSGEARGESRPGRGLPEGRMDVVYSLEVETPHVKWADPYQGGPIRAWMMPTVVGGRDVVELAQRLSLVYDTLTLDRGGLNAWGFGDFYGERGGAHGRPYHPDYDYLVEDLTAETRYDVLVLPGAHPWNALPEEARKAILERVRAGAGLVLITPNADPKDPLGFDELSPLMPAGPVPAEEGARPADLVSGEEWRVTEDHFITRGLPLETFPFDQMSLRPCSASGEVLIEAGGHPVLAVKQYGRGRVVALAYDSICFAPQLKDPWAVEKTYPYWEYFYSLLCRAIVWAAGREHETRLSAISADAQKVRVELTGGKDEVVVELTVRDDRYETEYSRTVTAKAGSVECDLPDTLNGGLHFADVIVRGGSGVLDWGTAAFEAPRPVRIVSVSPREEVVQVGGRVTGEVRLRADSPAEALAAVTFEDNYGRVLSRREQTISVSGEAAVPFDLSTAHCLTRLGRVVCEVRQGAHLLDHRSASLFVRIPQVWDDYEIIMDRFLPEPPPGRWPAIARQLEKMNVSVMGAISPAMAEHVNFKIQADVVSYGFHPRYHQPQWNENKRRWLETGDKKYLVREPCFSSPEFHARFRDELSRRVSDFARFSPVSYYAYEEPSLTFFEDSLDICWSPTCLAGFRDWLRETYGSLEALNAEWETDYTSWDDVVPLTSKEAQEKGNYAPWADHRTFMETMWADVYREGRDIIKGIDPNAVICLSGNQVGNPFNGYDYSRLNRYLDQMQQYTGENLEEFNRSFYHHLKLTGCTGYGASDPELALQLWGRLLNGDTAGCVIFWEISCLDPDLTFCRSGADLAKHFAELRGGGIARLLGAADRDNCGIAIHYSYPSLHGTWISDGEIKENAWERGSKANELFNRDRMGWTRLLEGLGYQYDFLAYSQIEQGELMKQGYRVLIMPDSVAVSEAEAKAIEQFVEAGGVVVADIWPGVMDEHCKWRRRGRLDDLLGITQAVPRPADLEKLDAWKQVTAAGAERGWSAADPRAVVSSHGQGKAIYLGRSLAPVAGEDKISAEELTQLVKLVSDALDQAGAKPPAEIADDQGRPVLSCEAVHYRAGEAEYYGIIRYQSPEQREEVDFSRGIPPLEEARVDLAGDNVRIVFPEARHIYDVRAHRYLGLTDRVEGKLEYGEAKIYALLPYRVEGMEVRAPEQAAPGAEVTYTVQVRTEGDAAPGTHVAVIRVMGPDGREYRQYGGRVALEHGRGEAQIPLALNDPAGEWRIIARDVATGIEAETTFLLGAGL